MPRRVCYLDYAATTPVDPAVLHAMLPFFGEAFGNPSSVHAFGQRAEQALSESRRRIASVLHGHPDEIIFTSGGSESDNLALRGAALAARRERGASRILTSPVEHPAVLHTARRLAEEDGFALEMLPVDSFGRVDPDEVRARIHRDTAVVSVMYANNEIGTLNPVAEIGAICRERGIAFHTDAVQAASQLPLDTGLLHVDLMSLGAHKFYGPKGVGVLFVRQGMNLATAQSGGGQERGRRAGTENVPLIVGMAEALDLTQRTRPQYTPAFADLRDRLLAGVPRLDERCRITGHSVQRLPNHASFAFEHLSGHELTIALDLAGFACSSGSACKTGDPRPSGVLLALGFQPSWALGSLRVTVGRETSGDEVDSFLTALADILPRLRHPAPAPT